MAINKVVRGDTGTVLIDLTSDTATKDKVLSGYKFHTRDGEQVSGTCSFDADTSSATAESSHVISGKTFFAQGNEVTGEMVNNGGVAGEIANKNDKFLIPVGYHDGSGYVELSSAAKAALVPESIKSGASIMGVTGTYGGNSCVSQTKTVTASFSKQTVNPDSGYTHLTSVTVNAMPYVEQANAAGGTTVTIG